MYGRIPPSRPLIHRPVVPLAVVGLVTPLCHKSALRLDLVCDEDGQEKTRPARAPREVTVAAR